MATYSFSTIDYIIGGRGTGKTAKLVRLSAETGAPIVAISEVSVKYIKNLAERLAYKIPEPYTISQVLAGKLRGKDNAGILLDDAEQVIKSALAAYLNTTVKTVVINDDNMVHTLLTDKDLNRMMI